MENTPRLRVIFVLLIICPVLGSSWRWRYSWRPPRWQRRMRDEAGGIKAVKSYEYLVRLNEDNSEYGPNVCSFEVDSRRTMMSDVFWERVLGVRLYGKTKLVACCPGFTSDANKKGCPKELYASSESLVQLAKSSNLRSLVTSVTEAGLGDALLGEGPLTVFAPTNEAFKRYKETSQYRSSKENQDSLKSLLLNHVVPGKIVSEELYEGKELKTLAGNILKIGRTCDGKGKAVAGSKILPESNLGASNGIIHTIDRVITTPTESLKDFLEKRPQFQRFVTYLDAAGLKFESPVTVFVFSDKSIEDMEADFLQQPCDGTKKMIQHHILSGGHYMSHFSPRSRENTFLGESLRIHLENSTYKVNNVEVIASDIPVTDGVVHVLEKPVVPLKARDVVNAASRFDFASQFLKVLTTVDGEKETLRNGNWTVFIPTNAAFAKIPEQVGKKIEDTDYLSKVLLYHVVPGMVYPENFKNDQLLKTLSSSTKLRINVYRKGSVLTINGVQLSKYSCVCNGVIYFIDEVMVPPEENVMDILTGDEDLSILRSLLQNSGLTALIKDRTSLTLFAPTNKAFERLNLPQNVLNSPPEEVVELLKYHVLPSVVFSSALTNRKCYAFLNSFYRSRTFQTLQGRPVRLTASGSGNDIASFQVNRFNVTQRNRLGKDGVVHVIDEVLTVPSRSQVLRFAFSYL